jgi:4-hydroxy-tetrahydrodipicolinate synthase
VASNVIPSSMRRLCDLARAGKRDDALEWDAALHDAFDFLGVEPNPIPVKAILSRLGIGRGLRLPLTVLSPVHAERAARLTDRLQQLEQSCRDILAA